MQRLGCFFLVLGLVQPAPHPTPSAVPVLEPSLTQLFLVSAPIGSFPGKFESQAPFLLRNSLKSCLQGPASSLSSWALSLVTPGSGSRAYYTLHTSWQVRSPPPPPPHPHTHTTTTLFGTHLCMGLTGSAWKIKNPAQNHPVPGAKTAAKMPPGLQLPRLPSTQQGACGS